MIRQILGAALLSATLACGSPAGTADHLIQVCSDPSATDAEVYARTDEIVSGLSLPSQLKDAVVATRVWILATPRDGVCIPCNRLEAVQAQAMGRLAAIGSDDAAKELVSLLERTDLRWDGGDSLTLGMFITRMGTQALPHLERIRSKSPKAQQLIDCINAGSPCT